MNNIPQEQLLALSASTDSLLKEINTGVDWVSRFLKNEKKIRNAYELKRYRRRLKKIKNAITQKPAIALFGASQVGKSYLVKNILSDNKNRLVISDPSNNNGGGVDFIKEINPVGDGAEATSVVTRFTFDEGSTDLPVKIKVLSPKDFIIILCDSYFSDTKKKGSHIRKNDIEEVVQSLDHYYSGQGQHFLDEDEVYEVDEYLDKIFKADLPNLLAEFKDAKYWDTVAANIHKIAPQDWGKVFSILWGHEEEITMLFDLLVGKLQEIGFPKTLKSDFDPVLREKGTILDVQRISEIFDQNPDRVKLFTDAGNEVSISRGILCALSAEVILNISSESVQRNPFIKETDILDFPGARSRLKLEHIEKNNLKDMLLRGKVAYLFNAYSLNYEISNLFVCTHSKQSDVRNLPELINNWIDYNIGEDVEERSKTLQQFSSPPLFIIFTWWNMQLTFDQDNDVLKEGDAPNKDPYEHKWDLRFNRLFQETIMDKGRYTWDREWINGKSFKNYYLLRDFKYSKDVFDGFEATGEEGGIRPLREEYFGKLRQSFLRDSHVNRFFDNPEHIWQSTSTSGNDGSRLIIESIQQNVSNRVRTQRYINILNNSKKRAQEILNAHFHSDKADEKIQKAASEGSDIQGYMNKIFGQDAINFGIFIENMTIAEKDIYEFFHAKLRDNVLIEKESTNEYILFRESSPRLSTEYSYEENLRILMEDYNKASLEDTEAYFQEELKIDLTELFFGELNNLKNRSTVLSEEARDFWFEQKLNPGNFERFVKLGFRQDLLEKLFDNIKLNFNRLDLVSEIARHIRTYVDDIKRIDEAENMIAHITAGIINNFINSVGWSFYPEEEKQQIRTTNIENKLNLIFPEDENSFQSLEEDALVKLFDFMQDLNSNLNKVPLDRDTVKNVPMIRHYRRWRELMKISFISNCDIPVYDINANKELGQILDKLAVYNFQLDHS